MFSNSYISIIEDKKKNKKRIKEEKKNLRNKFTENKNIKEKNYDINESKENKKIVCIVYLENNEENWI